MTTDESKDPSLLHHPEPPSQPPLNSIFSKKQKALIVLIVSVAATCKCPITDMTCQLLLKCVR